jgi:hypothetical protein
MTDPNVTDNGTGRVGIELYPCTYGTRMPMGWHHYEANSKGIVVCTLCGKKVKQ